MLKIDVPLEDALKRNNFVFKNNEILTECIKSYEGISFLGESFGPFEKGNTYKIRYFVAIPFIERNILKISFDEKCDDKDIQRFAVNEVNVGEVLTKQEDPYFLTKLKEYRVIMEKNVNERKIPKVDLDRYNSYASNYIDNRLVKILKLSKTDISLDEEKKLTNSETALFKIVSKVIRSWRKFFSSY
jgi:hypothetical protein